MDYSSQDSNPIDFSKSNKDLAHNKAPSTHHASEEDLERRVIPVVRCIRTRFCVENLNTIFIPRIKTKTTTEMQIIVWKQHQL